MASKKTKLPKQLLIPGALGRVRAVQKTSLAARPATPITLPPAPWEKTQKATREDRPRLAQEK